MALTDDARKELQEAIRIVREDRFESHARSILSGFKPKEEPPKEEPPKDEPPKDAPPKKDEPPKDEPPKNRRSSYWGELIDD